MRGQEQDGAAAPAAVRQPGHGNWAESCWRQEGATVLWTKARGGSWAERQEQMKCLGEVQAVWGQGGTGGVRPWRVAGTLSTM